MRNKKTHSKTGQSGNWIISYPTLFLSYQVSQGFKDWIKDQPKSQETEKTTKGQNRKKNGTVAERARERGRERDPKLRASGVSESSSLFTELVQACCNKRIATGFTTNSKFWICCKTQQQSRSERSMQFLQAWDGLAACLFYQWENIGKPFQQPEIEKEFFGLLIANP